MIADASVLPRFLAALALLSGAILPCAGAAVEDRFDYDGVAGVSPERPDFWSHSSQAGTSVAETNGALACAATGKAPSRLHSIVYSALEPAFGFFHTNLLLQVRGLEVEQDYDHDGGGLCNCLRFQLADTDATDNFWMDADKLWVQLDSGTGTPSGPGQSLLRRARIYGTTTSGATFETMTTVAENITGFDLVADVSGCRLTVYHGATNTMLYTDHTFSAADWNHGGDASLSIYPEKFESAGDEDTLVQRIGSVTAAPTSISADPWSGQQVHGPAAACDHRLGAVASFTQNTDTAATQSFFYAEACAFRFNLQGTVYDSPFNGDLSVAQRRDARDTGRLGFEIYLQTDRWRDPDSIEDAFPVIPDYYRDTYSQAGVDAGFNVTPGESKTTRRPNHGDQLYDISNGMYGYDTAADTPGEKDVFGDLVRYQKNWVKNVAGYYPAAAAFRNGQQGARYAIPRYLLGARNSSRTGDIRYGASAESFPYCGQSGAFGPDETRSYPSTTRVGDRDEPAADVIAHCTNLLAQTIRYRGWYRDFIHWHTSPRFELTLHDFYQAVRSHVGGSRVACVSSGEALQHKCLRDMAEVTLTEQAGGLLLDVTYEDPWGLPMECFRIPLSVKIWLDQTGLAGSDLSSPDAVSLRKLDTDLVVVEVPFRRKEETVRVHLDPTTDPAYPDESLPVIESVDASGAVWTVQTDQPTRLALFSWPETLDLGDLRPTNRAHRVDIVMRSNELSTLHTVDLAQSPADLSGRSIYIGAITDQRQSVLDGPYMP